MNSRSPHVSAARKRVARLALVVIAVPFIALVVSASSASAANTSSSSGGTGTPSSSQPGLICNTQPSSSSSATASSSSATSATNSAGSVTAQTDNLLPVNRWSGAIGDEHDRLPGGLLSSITNAPDEMERPMMVGGMTSIGAAEWQLGVSSTEAASEFCFANSIGVDANSIAATLGNAIENANILAILAVIAVIAAAWRSMRRSENPTRQMAKFTLVAALFTGIVAAATASAANPTAPPVAMSPSWIVTTAYTAVSNVASAPAAAISVGANELVGGSTQQTISKSDPLSCYWYTQELVDKYQAAYGSDNTGYVVPVTLNSLWEQAAIPAYTSEQFGSNNNYGPLIYCHLLEDQAGTAPSTQQKIAIASGSLSNDTNLASYGPLPTNASGKAQPGSSLAWNGAITNDQEDESMVAWAACQSPNDGSSGTGGQDGSGFTPSEWNASTGALETSAWTVVQNTNSSGDADTTVSGADCQVFWSANAPASGGQYGDAVSGSPFASPGSAPWAGQNSNPDYSVFNWGDSPSAIATSTNGGTNGDVEISNFLSNLHGTSNANAIATSFIFLLSSTVVMIVFLVLSLAVIIAKLSLLLSMMVLPAMMILALLPGGATGKFAAYTKHMFGLLLFSTTSAVLLAFVSIITGAISDIGSSAFGQGSLFSMMWVAMAPVSALYIVHIFFKKVLKAPSPFRPGAAAGYAAALGGFGGGVVGADVFSHMRNRGAQAAGMARSRMGGKNGKGRGGPSRGNHSMGGGSGPGGGVATDVAAGAVGVGVGAAASQSIFTKRERKQRRVDTEQYLANQHARSERVSSLTKNLERAKGSLLNPGYATGLATGVAQKRAKESLGRIKDRFNQREEGDGARRTHRVRGSILTAAAGASAIGRGAKRLPKVAKYGALGASGIVAASFGAPVLAGAGALYGARRLRKYHRTAPVRQANNLVNYRVHQQEQQNRVDEARRQQEDAANKSEKERQELADRQQQEREQSERDARDAEERIAAWRSGNLGPRSGSPQGPRHNEGPSGPRGRE